MAFAKLILVALCFTFLPTYAADAPPPVPEKWKAIVTGYFDYSTQDEALADYAKLPESDQRGISEILLSVLLRQRALREVAPDARAGLENVMNDFGKLGKPALDLLPRAATLGRDEKADPEKRAAALQLLSRCQAKTHTALFERALTEKGQETPFYEAAIWGISSGSPKTELGVFLQALTRRDLPPSIRIKLVNGLRKYRRQAAQVLPVMTRELLAEGVDGEVAEKLFAEMSNFGAPFAEAKDALFDNAMKRLESASERSAAIRVLTELKDRRAAKRLKELYPAGDPKDLEMARKQLEVAGALEALGEPVKPSPTEAVSRLFESLLAKPEDQEERENLTKIEDLKKHLHPRAYAAFDSATNAAFRRILEKRKIPDRSSCEVICAVAKRAKDWFDTSKVPPGAARRGKDDEEMPLSYQFAYSSLGGLFFEKTAAVCPESAQMAKDLRANHLGDLHRLGARVKALTAKNVPKSAATIYGKQFYLMYLRELLRQKPAADEEKALQENIASIEASLNQDIERWRDARHSYTGSLFITYSLATTLLGTKTPPAKELAAFEEFIQTYGIESLPYAPPPEGEEVERFSDTTRGASARGVPAALAVLLRTTQTKPSQYLDLLKALYNYNFHSFALIYHVDRKETHLGFDSLAPYFYYATIPYATAALHQLLEQDLPAEHRKELENVSETLRRGLLSLVDDGLFTKMGREVSSGVYANPLAALALLPYCEKEKQLPPQGILQEKLPDFSGHARTLIVPGAHAP